MDPLAERVFEQRRRRAPGRGEERVAGHEEHDELRRRRELLPVGLGCEGVDVLPRCFACAASRSARTVSSVASWASRYADSVTFESTTMFLPPTRLITMSGRSRPSEWRPRLARRSRSGRHPGELDASAQLELAPLAACLRLAQCADQRCRLTRNCVAGRSNESICCQHGLRAPALLLDLPELALDLAERLSQRAGRPA